MNHLAGNVGGIVGCQEFYGFGDIFGRSAPAQGNLFQVRSLHILGQRCRHIGDDVPGGDGVNRNAPGGKFPGGDLYIGTLTNDGVGLAPYHDYEDQVPAELKQEVNDIVEGIRKGEIDTGW